MLFKVITTVLMVLLTITSTDIFVCNSCITQIQLHIVDRFLIFNLIFLFSGNTTVDELMMRLMGAMEIFTAQQQEDIKDEVRFEYNQTYS